MHRKMQPGAGWAGRLSGRKESVLFSSPSGPGNPPAELAARVHTSLGEMTSWLTPSARWQM